MPRRPSTHVDSPAAVGERLRAARLAAGLSQRDLSFEGCTAAYVSRIEAGARTPSYQILREFATRLGVTADYLATGDDGVSEPDPRVEAEILLRLGRVDEAEEIFREAGAEAGLGAVTLARGDARQAIELLAAALASGELSPEAAEAAAERLARAYCLQGQFEEALALLTRVLDDARARRDRFAVARFGVLLAGVYIDIGDLAQAERILSEALADAQETLDPALRAQLYWREGYAELAAASLRSTDQQLAAARGLALLARIENERGNGEQALARLDEAMPELRCAGNDVEQAMASIERARALAGLGQEAEAISLLADVVPRLEDAPAESAAPAYVTVARFFRARGDHEHALELYALAAERAPAPSRHAANALSAMAEIHEERGEADEALRLLKAALAARSGVTSA